MNFLLRGGRDVAMLRTVVVVLVVVLVVVVVAMMMMMMMMMMIVEVHTLTAVSKSGWTLLRPRFIASEHSARNKVQSLLLDRYETAASTCKHLDPVSGSLGTNSHETVKCT